MRQPFVLACALAAACSAAGPTAPPPDEDPGPPGFAFTADAPALPELTSALDPADLREVRVRLDALDPVTRASRGPSEFHGPEALHLDAAHGDFALAWDGGRAGVLYHVTVLDDGHVLGGGDVAGGSGARVAFRVVKGGGGSCNDSGCTPPIMSNCTVGYCDPATGQCAFRPAADGSGCRGGTCLGGDCMPTPVVCSALTEGSLCDDHDACTDNDRCQAGACVGVARACAAPDACHDAGTCNPSTGLCQASARPDGSACNDGNACTSGDACHAGTCSGAPVTCAGDACHDPGTCDPATGTCQPSARPEGSSCDDGNACPSGDACHAGSCRGASTSCPALDCHGAGTCNPGDGQCHYPLAPDGSFCEDGNLCTYDDRCVAGACVAGESKQCGEADACSNPGVCNPGTGWCEWTPRTGNACDDGNPCTQDDRCDAGNCVGGATITCTAKDACHVAGECRPATGVCSNPLKVDDPSCVPPANPPAAPVTFSVPDGVVMPRTYHTNDLLFMIGSAHGLTMGLAYREYADTPVTRWGECLSRVSSCYDTNPVAPLRGCIARIERCTDPAGGHDCCPDACIDSFFDGIAGGLDDDDAIDATFLQGACVPGFVAATGGTP